jgi:lipopolysaccharide export system protein LptA
MTGASIRTRGAALLALVLACGGAEAATKPAAPPADSSPIQILPGTSSKEPISIDADKLVYFDKEKKAVYSGNVVVIQGDTKMTCSVMTVYLDHSASPANASSAHSGAAPANAPGDPQSPAADSGIKRLEATGPVTVVSKTQVATGDNGTYDKAENRVQLIGHVTLSDGQNVTKGDKLTYDLKSGQATIDTAGSKSGRVHGQFVPKGGDADQTKSDQGKPGQTKSK